MESPLKITSTQARRLALDASLLYGKSQLPKKKEGVLAVINHLGYIQMDTISVVERAHLHILWTRCPGFKPEYLHQLQSEDYLFCRFLIRFSELRTDRFVKCQVYHAKA